MNAVGKNLKQLRQQFEESQQKQEIKDREQAKEKQIDRLYDLLAIGVAIASMIISLVK